MSDGVHATHCCVEHGCKYGDPDCPVKRLRVKQEHPCEWCSGDEHDPSPEQVRFRNLQDLLARAGRERRPYRAKWITAARCLMLANRRLRANGLEPIGVLDPGEALRRLWKEIGGDM